MPIFLSIRPFSGARTIPVNIHLPSRRGVPEVAFPTTQFPRRRAEEIRRQDFASFSCSFILFARSRFCSLRWHSPALADAGPRGHPRRRGRDPDRTTAEAYGGPDEQARPRTGAAKQRAPFPTPEARRRDLDRHVDPARRDGRAPRVRPRAAPARLDRVSDVLPARLTESISNATVARASRFPPPGEPYASRIQNPTHAGGAPRFERRARPAFALRNRGSEPRAEPRDPGRGPRAASRAEGAGLSCARGSPITRTPSDRVAVRVRRGDALVGGATSRFTRTENR